MQFTVYKGSINSNLQICFAIGPNGVEKIGINIITTDFLKSLQNRNWSTKPFNKKIVTWLDVYLKGNNPAFPYPLKLCGSEFQIAVWKSLQKIPFGQTRTYKYVAKDIGRPNATRAVGSACGANNFPLVIPCHRVVSSTGLGGFSGGLQLKKALLAIEGHHL